MKKLPLRLLPLLVPLALCGCASTHTLAVSACQKPAPLTPELQAPPPPPGAFRACLEEILAYGRSGKLLEQIAAWYQHLRGSPAFLVIVTLWIGGDFFLHYRFGWDKDWGATNLQFSIEAVYNGVFSVMALAALKKMQLEAEARHTKLLKYIATTMEAQVRILRKLARLLPEEIDDE